MIEHAWYQRSRVEIAESAESVQSCSNLQTISTLLPAHIHGIGSGEAMPLFRTVLAATHKNHIETQHINLSYHQLPGFYLACLKSKALFSSQYHRR